MKPWLLLFTLAPALLSSSCLTKDKHHLPQACQDGCPTETPLCSETLEACVECLATSDCKSADASRCSTDDQSCAPCESNEDCAHIEGKGLCDDEKCVECTIATEAERCGANSCNPATNECTDTARASVDICQTCVADSECDGDDVYCVPMQFSPDGEPITEVGGYCLKSIPDDLVCPRPYSSPISRTTLSGVEDLDFCGVAEPLTTCSAVLDLIEDVPKACEESTECGLPDLDDGVCGLVTGAGKVCSYACTAGNQCPESAVCPGGGGYCGKP